MVYNSTAFIETEHNGLKVAKGNVTEVGLINYLMNSKIDVESLIKKKKEDNFIEFIIPFNSIRKK